MPTLVDPPLPPPHDEGHGSGSFIPPARRIRHITSIQIRNLTPFPVRDAFTSALTRPRPSEQPQFTSPGHLSDDLDVALARKRSRKISAGSIGTLRSRRLDSASVADEEAAASGGGGNPGGASGAGSTSSPDGRGRKRAPSKVSFVERERRRSPSGGQMSASGSGSAPTVRPNRPRTNSSASSISRLGGSGPPSASAGTSSFSTLLPDHSQRGLDRVIRSRLVETFIAVTLPEPVGVQDVKLPNGTATRADGTPLSPTSPNSGSGFVRHTSSLSKSSGLLRRNGSVSSSNSTASQTTRGASPLRSATAPNSKATPRPGPSKSPLTPAKVSVDARANHSTNGKAPASTAPSALSPKSFRFPAPASTPSSPTTSAPSAASSTEPAPSSAPAPAHLSFPSTPSYLSPAHRPSTNPVFDFDAADLAPDADPAAECIRVDLYGRIPPGSPAGSDVAGKGKARASVPEEGAGEGEDVNAPKWKLLEHWTFRLAELVPLSDDLATHPAHMPFNSLLVTLAPSGRTYHLPPPTHSARSSRAPSPAGAAASGYSSDPETAGRAVVEPLSPSASGFAPTAMSPPGSAVSFFAPRHFGGGGSAPPTPASALEFDSDARAVRRGARTVRTAGWQELLRLASLQGVIADTRQSLADVERGIGDALLGDGLAALKREQSEREACVARLREDGAGVTGAADDLRARMAQRRADLQRRRETLALAREGLEEDVRALGEVEKNINVERASLAALRSKLHRARTGLITTLASIYPIELASPADLLFTILGAALPIPLGVSDPAPPLSLPAAAGAPEVSEDGVASALGFAAQVVLLLAAYLGRRLVYPVTCVGSRSLVRDGISAMVGPRMFPLFAKGVDTYRFEYGVFLLNKDIEMLMAERDLRALDIRHTLPNLKNLLLTLADGENPAMTLSRPLKLSSSMLSLGSLGSPLATPPALPADAPDPLALALSPAQPKAPPPSPANGAPPAAAPRRSRLGLGIGLAPLSGLGFLRGRYPSSASAASSPVMKAVPEAPEETNGDVTASASTPGLDASTPEDEEDRNTIRGVVRDEHGRGASDSETDTEAETDEDTDADTDAEGDSPAADAAEDEGKREVRATGHGHVAVLPTGGKGGAPVIAIQLTSPSPPLVS